MIKLVMFTTPTCSSCKLLKPFLEQYGGETGHQIVYQDATQSTLGFQFSAVPTIVIFKNNRPVNMLTGVANDPRETMAKIRAAVAAA